MPFKHYFLFEKNLYFCNHAKKIVQAFQQLLRVLYNYIHFVEDIDSEIIFGLMIFSIVIHVQEA